MLKRIPLAGLKKEKNESTNKIKKHGAKELNNLDVTWVSEFTYIVENVSKSMNF